MIYVSNLPLQAMELAALATESCGYVDWWWKGVQARVVAYTVRVDMFIMKNKNINISNGSVIRGCPSPYTVRLALCPPDHAAMLGLCYYRLGLFRDAERQLLSAFRETPMVLTALLQGKVLLGAIHAQANASIPSLTQHGPWQLRVRDLYFFIWPLSLTTNSCWHGATHSPQVYIHTHLRFTSAWTSRRRPLRFTRRLCAIFRGRPL